MTVQTTNVRHLLTATGTNRNWEYTFRAINTAHVQLWEETAPDVWAQVDPADYTVTLNSNGVGGEVTYPLAPAPVLAAGKRVVLVRETNRQQLVEINNTTTYRPEVLGRMIDKLAVITQDLAFKIDRTLQLGPHASRLSYSQMVAGELVKFDGTKFVAGGTFEGLEALEAAAAASAAAAAASATSAAGQVALAAAQVTLAAGQVTLANTARTETEELRDDTQDIFDAAATMLSGIVGTTIIPCSAVWDSELGTGTITLTPLIPYEVLAAGMMFRFRAPSPIFGIAPLIRIGSTFYGVLLNRAGGEVQGDYVRTDLDTTIVYDGTNFRAGREIERGVNGNGEWVRYEDGTQECTHSFTGLATDTAVGAIFASATSSNWTFPVSFESDTIPVCHADVNASGKWANCWSASNTSVNIREFSFVSGSGTYAVRVSARGKWYD